MCRSSSINFFDGLLYILLACLLFLYIFSSYSEITLMLNRYTFLYGMVILSFLYLFKYRKDNLFCFETIFFILYILSVFFNELILFNINDNSSVSSVYYTSFPATIRNKSTLLQSIAFVVFMLGASKANIKVSNTNIVVNQFMIPYNFKIIIWILSIFILGLICLLYLNGTIASWFHYSYYKNNYTNEYIVYLTILFLVLTAYEFSYLHKIGCNNFFSLLKSINKIYLFDITIISVLLLISGNRNEALLILFPPIIGYSIFIQRIKNKQFILGIICGIILMILIGVTRHTGVSVKSFQNSNVSLFEISRDFGLVDLNTMYLIDYTDCHGPIYFKNATINLFSSIPFLGGVFVTIFNIDRDIRSTEITTNGMQSFANMDSGLGTSLVGDLYYTGNFILVIIYMYFFGWLVSYLYDRYIIRKQYNIWLLIIFLYLMSNVVYCVRAEWTMPFRYIGFAFVVIIVSQIFIPKIKYNKSLISNENS